MAQIDYQARLGKFILKVTAIFVIFGGVYALYLYNLYQTLPKVKTGVTEAYSMFTGLESYSAQPGADGEKKPKGWTQISARTSDTQLHKITTMSEDEAAKKVKEVEGYDKLLNGNSMKLLHMISGLLKKTGGKEVMNNAEEKKMKDMINQILDAYKNKRYPGIKEIEKETGKL